MQRQHHSSLHASDIARFRDDGFLFPIDVMPAAEAIALRTELEQIEAD